MTFDAIADYVNHSTASTREIYPFPTTLSILRQYAQKALCIKTPLSRGCRMFRVSLHEERRCIFHAVLHDVGARKSGQAMLDY